MFSKLFRRPDPTPSLEAFDPVEPFDLFAKPNSRFAILDWVRVEESLATRLAPQLKGSIHFLAKRQPNEESRGGHKL
jgi:hypothetical protein